MICHGPRWASSNLAGQPLSGHRVFKRSCHFGVHGHGAGEQTRCRDGLGRWADDGPVSLPSHGDSVSTIETIHLYLYKYLGHPRTYNLFSSGSRFKTRERQCFHLHITMLSASLPDHDTCFRNPSQKSTSRSVVSFCLHFCAVFFKFVVKPFESLNVNLISMIIHVFLPLNMGETWVIIIQIS